jgi:hypothetical protein
MRGVLNKKIGHFQTAAIKKYLQSFSIVVFGYSYWRPCGHTIRRCCQGNFQADCHRWLDLFSDEQINAMKNDPLDDSSVGVALRLR